LSKIEIDMGKFFLLYRQERDGGEMSKWRLYERGSGSRACQFHTIKEAERYVLKVEPSSGTEFAIVELTKHIKVRREYHLDDITSKEWA
jgi:hypothetical protein